MDLKTSPTPLPPGTTPRPFPIEDLGNKNPCQEFKVRQVTRTFTKTERRERKEEMVYTAREDCKSYSVGGGIKKIVLIIAVSTTITMVEYL